MQLVTIAGSAGVSAGGYAIPLLAQAVWPVLWTPVDTGVTGPYFRHFLQVIHPSRPDIATALSIFGRFIDVLGLWQVLPRTDVQRPIYVDGKRGTVKLNGPEGWAWLGASSPDTWPNGPLWTWLFGGDGAVVHQAIQMLDPELRAMVPESWLIVPFQRPS